MKDPSVAVTPAPVHVLPSSRLYSTPVILVRLSVAFPVNVGVLSLVESGESALSVTTGFVVSTVKLGIAPVADSLPA